MCNSHSKEEQADGGEHNNILLEQFLGPDVSSTDTKQDESERITSTPPAHNEGGLVLIIGLYIRSFGSESSK
jgi:hypothetical protein